MQNLYRQPLNLKSEVQLNKPSKILLLVINSLSSILFAAEDSFQSNASTSADDKKSISKICLEYKKLEEMYITAPIKQRENLIKVIPKIKTKEEKKAYVDKVKLETEANKRKLFQLKFNPKYKNCENELYEDPDNNSN